MWRRHLWLTRREELEYLDSYVTEKGELNSEVSHLEENYKGGVWSRNQKGIVFESIIRSAVTYVSDT